MYFDCLFNSCVVSQPGERSTQTADSAFEYWSWNAETQEIWKKKKKTYKNKYSTI